MQMLGSCPKQANYLANTSHNDTTFIATDFTFGIVITKMQMVPILLNTL